MAYGGHEVRVTAIAGERPVAWSGQDAREMMNQWPHGCGFEVVPVGQDVPHRQGCP